MIAPYTMYILASLFLICIISSNVTAFHHFSNKLTRSSSSKNIANIKLTKVAVREQKLSLNQFKNFDDMLTNVDKPVLVDFYAQWCGPCVMMQPVLEDVAGRMEKELLVAKVDTDKSPRLGNRFQVEALPTLILFNKGEVVERFVGYMNADELEMKVKGTLKRINAST